MNDPAGRIIAPDMAEADTDEASLRPQVLDDFIGQTAIRENFVCLHSGSAEPERSTGSYDIFRPTGTRENHTSPNCCKRTWC